MTDAAPLDLRLAPMAGVTNVSFRLLARECGAGLLTSEEIDARALVEDNAHTREIARHLPEERPLAMQLLGADRGQGPGGGAHARPVAGGDDLPRHAQGGHGPADDQDPGRVG